MDNKAVFSLERGIDPTIIFDSKKEAYRLLYQRIREAKDKESKLNGNTETTESARITQEIKLRILSSLCSKGYVGKHSFQNSIKQWPKFDQELYEQAFFEVLEELEVDM